MTLDAVLAAHERAKISARTAADAALVAEQEARTTLIALDDLEHALTVHKAEHERVSEPKPLTPEQIDEAHYANFSALFAENRRMMAHQYANMGKLLPAGWGERVRARTIAEHFGGSQALFDGWATAGNGNTVLSEPDFQRMLKMAIAANRGQAA